MLRSITILKLPVSIRSKLQSMGYEYVEDLERVVKSREDVSNFLQKIITEYKIKENIEKLNSKLEFTSGDSLWHFEFCNPPIAVFHEGLDKLLDGGLAVGKFTELCGPPGCGKTQMCLQFCVDAQMPSCMGGSAAGALYISTDFGFRLERLRQIIQGSIKHCSTTVTANLTAGNLLQGIHIIKAHQVKKLYDVIKALKNFFQTNPNVKLLVIDSFSLPFIIEVEDLLLRSKIIAEVLDLLLEYAIKYKFAVVLTNQLSTLMTSSNKSVLKPSLGEGFGHRLHYRLLLDDGKIYLMKSINHPQLYTQFEITKEGIR